MIDQRLAAEIGALESGGNGHGLNDAEHDGEIAGVLSDLAPAKLAFDYGDRKIELGLPIAMIWAVVIVGMIGVILAAAANVFLAGRDGEGAAP